MNTFGNINATRIGLRFNARSNVHSIDCTEQSRNDIFDSKKDITELEREFLGFDHAEVGEALLHHWNMTDNLCASVRYHHNPGGAQDAHLEASLIHIADQVTHCAQESKDPLGSQFYDPYGALLDSDLNAEDISTNSIAAIQDEALELTKISEEDIIALGAVMGLVFGEGAQHQQRKGRKIDRRDIEPNRETDEREPGNDRHEAETVEEPRHQDPSLA